MNINHIFCSLPAGYDSVVRKKGEDYLIVINSNIAMNRQKIALQHELEHIKNNDLDKDILVDEIECLRHRQEI